MKIFVQAKPNAREECVEKVDSTHFIVSVRELPIQGRANFAIIKALAKYFKIKPYQVKIISGRASKQKVVEVGVEVVV